MTLLAITALVLVMLAFVWFWLRKGCRLSDLSQAIVLAVWIVIASLLGGMLGGCQSYEATWPDGPTIRVMRIGTDAKIGRLKFTPQTGELEVENLDSTATLAHELAKIAGAAAGVAP